MKGYSAKKLTLTYDQYMQNGYSLSDLKIDHYVIFQSIGEGTSGKVFRGINDYIKKQVAVKLIDLRMIQKEYLQDIRKIRIKLCESESILMMKCNSQNVLKCYDVYENQDLKVMIIQYCNGISLEDEIKAKKKIPEDQSICLMKQIINGIAELHRHGIVHRDLKADNIISHNGIYKIIDFGFSKQMEEPEKELHQTTLGTRETMAPEVHRKQPYGIKADIWSIGIIFFQMIFGELPYKQYSDRILNEIKYKKIFNVSTYTYKNHTISQQATRFLREVLTIKTSQRLGYKQLKAHQIFKSKTKLANEFRVMTELDLPEIKEEEEYFQLICIKQRFVEQIQVGDCSFRSSISKMSKQEVQLKKTEINNEDQKMYQWVKQRYLQCLKTQLIFNHIVLILIKHQKQIDISSRFVIEMIYLLLTRCRSNLSIINEQLKIKKHQLLVNLAKMVRNLYEKVDNQWIEYSTKLTEVEDQIISMIMDRISKLISTEEMLEKDILLTGVETIDFSKENQIKYTYDKYLRIFCKEMPANSECLVYAKSIMIHYVEINQITVQEMKETSYPFYEYVRLKIFK